MLPRRSPTPASNQGRFAARLSNLALLATLALTAIGTKAAQAGPLGPAERPSASPLAAHAERSPKGSPAQVEAVPDIFGPGAVLRAGRVHMKVTNFGLVGNPFTNLSNDPSGQWPDESGVEYLHSIRLAVGAKDPTAVDSAQAHRVSYLFNWRPPSLDPEDRIYAASDGVINGARFFNDDNDVDPTSPLGYPLNQRVDEDFLDGRDNDGDGLIDEDFGALGQQMYSLVMRDDTQEAMAADSTYVPLGLECRQLAWAYSRQGFADFNVVEYTFFNRSGHTLDSVYVGWVADLDCGPITTANYYQDDLDLPGFPSGEFILALPTADRRRQLPHHPILNSSVPSDSALCPRVPIRVNGFAVSDDDGDGGRTPGVSTFLLVSHTFDPLGQSAPSRTGFRAFRSFTAGTPYENGGNPITSAQRYAFMSSTENIDPLTGFISAAPGTVPADYVQWCSIGPFRQLPPGGAIQATIAFAVEHGSHASGVQYAGDYQSFRNGSVTASELFTMHPVLRVAFDAQTAFEGVYERNEAYPSPDFHGRETGIILPTGSPPQMVSEDCPGRELRTAIVNDHEFSWFDFDCDYCTGIWDYPLGYSDPAMGGLFHRTWSVNSPLVGVPETGPGAARVTLAFPNPTHEGARLELILAVETAVRVGVYDLAGRCVRELARGPVPAGRHAITWDLRDDAGARVEPGLYFYRALLGTHEEAGKLVVVR